MIANLWRRGALSVLVHEYPNANVSTALLVVPTVPADARIESIPLRIGLARRAFSAK